MVHPDKIFGRLGNKMFQGAYLYAQVKKGEIPDIFVQDLSYFEDFEEEIKKLYSEGIGYLPYVAIHLRRGDYVNNSFYVDLAKTGYYIDAINQFPNRKFIVFSDDNAFAKMYFEGDKFSFDESKDEIEAFNKMASCDGIIMANSSFSWWAAYLNPNLDKKIVAPTVDKWYSDGLERTKCPKEWLRI